MRKVIMSVETRGFCDARGLTYIEEPCMKHEGTHLVVLLPDEVVVGKPDDVNLVSITFPGGYMMFTHKDNFMVFTNSDDLEV